MTPLSILSRILGQTGDSSGAYGLLLSFALRVVVRLIFSCLCLFDAIFKLHAMDEKCRMTPSLDSEHGFDK